ncbi:MAG: BlaI/MecI/CopY family transcriptional regulator [Candidatus Heimdallarchaeota archaeon]|nr:BlaI/MecI/CopY family transcriptional regulator [Candidatus Heimdallarchaeota archaeon]
MKELTKAEKQVMHILWEMERGFVKDLLEKFPDPKPAYNTVSTICRILESKGFLGYKSYGKSHQYYPLVSREQYTKEYLNNVVDSYFGNSIEQLVSFFSKENKVDIGEAEKIIELMNSLKEGKKDE